MELVFVRHGEPEWVADGKSQMDPSLTERGWQQAARVAERLSASRRGFDELIVSPAVRARQTAEPIAEALGLAPKVIDELVEIRLPDWRNLPPAEVRKSFELAKRRPPRGWWEGLPGGERFDAFHARVESAMQRLLAERGVSPRTDVSEHSHEIEDTELRIIIVAHGGTNAVALGILLGIPPTPWEWERFAMAHASLAKVRAVPIGDHHVFSLRGFNDVEHLPRELRSG